MRMKVWGEISGERHLVGTLETIPGREEQFSYAESYLESEVAQPLSVLLPLREGPFPARQTRVFFRNLLPEGGALAAVAKTLEVKSSSYLKVLNALGSECIGALVLESANEREDDSYGYEPLSREELGRAFEAGAEGVAKLQEEAKLSLAGAQSKMGLYVDRSSGSLPQYFLPQGTAASTHIVKAANRRFEKLSENEYYCLRLAEAAGLSVPECYLDTIGVQPVFVIERFDRMVLSEDDRRAGGGVRRVQRLHQEDFCQVLGLLPERKYERGGVRYAKKVRDTLYERSSDPVRDIEAFVRLLVVNAVLGNCDGHLKNLTVLRGADWSSFALAPAYDIASTVVYEGLDRHMAMRIGSTNKIDEVGRDDFLALAKELDVSPRMVRRLIEEVCEGVGGAASDALRDTEDALGAPLSKLHDIAAFARSQIDRLGVGRS
ncbi:HipA domain-containing protein [Adlercreutzia equolifaciens]|uniref:HipA domain-containing protein n=1 Tax=Adlercreutzia equolifaciens TaxID=446660 RepID=UPI003AEF3E34